MIENSVNASPLHSAPNPLHWSAAVQRCHQRGEAYVLATVMGVAGSTPREPGAKMVITEREIFSTIGGGQLEFAVMLKARTLLQQGGPCQQIEAFPLAASGQCCGGNVSVLLEYMAAARWQLWVFGAGHVARQLITILGGLHCQVNWLDNRPDMLPSASASAILPADSQAYSMPANVRCIYRQALTETLAELPATADVLVLTHDHALDFELTRLALQRNNWVGLIGSATKAARFRKRLQDAGVTPAQLHNLQCPVGHPDIPGKLPMEIAVAIVAELLRRQAAKSRTGAEAQSQPLRRGVDWKSLKQVLYVSATDSLASEPLASKSLASKPLVSESLPDSRPANNAQTASQPDDLAAAIIDSGASTP